MILRQTRKLSQQFLAYSFVGVISNCIGYCFYLIGTSAGLSPIQAMSLVYVCSCLLSFAGNKKWTFSDSTRAWKIFPRYALIQMAGYLTNLLLLMMLYKFFGVPHQLVQLIAIATVAIELFLLSKYFVFRGAESRVKI